MLRCSSGSWTVAQGVERRVAGGGATHMNIRANGSASPRVTPQGPWPG